MLNAVKSAFGGKKVILGSLVFFNLLLTVFSTSFALTPRFSPFPVPSPTPTKVDYVLPYPGILPDHLLYPVKMLRDRIWELLVTEPVKKTELLLLMADKRLGAGRVLVEGGKANLGEQTLSKGEKYLERAVNQALAARQQGKDISDLLDKLDKSVRKHLEVLEEVLSKAPEAAKPGIQNALENSRKGYQKVLELKGGK